MTRLTYILLLVINIFLSSCSSDIEEQVCTKKKETVLWLGTSIPMGVSSNAYPNLVGKALGCKLYNQALGASYLRKSTTVPTHSTKHAAYGLSTTLSEINTLLAQAKDLTHDDKKRIRSASYEERIIPYIDGTIAKCTTVIIDHGYNDMMNIKAIYDQGLDKIDWSSRDRGNTIGAFNYLYDRIMEVNANIRIIIAGFQENEGNWDAGENGHTVARYTYQVCELQKAIAQHYGFPLLKMWEKCNWTFNYHIPNSSSYLAKYKKGYTNIYPDSKGNVCMFQYFCPDGIHPHTSETKDDWSAKGITWLVPLYAKELSNLLE